MKNIKYSRYYDAIKYLESLNNFSNPYQKTNLTAHPHPEMYIERMQDFLDQIGNPEKNFKYIHIAGTAGKGSVSSIVHATLIDHGKKSGLFTSPFTVSTIEKIQVGNKYIDPVVFADITESLKPHIDVATISSRHGIPSYFELIFTIALIYFKKQKCEYAVIEVGLGGSYDATNIIKKPLITTITNIGLDHTQVLGTTTKKIAIDKAGIIKKNSHFFTTESNRQILSIFQDKCANVGALYHSCIIRKLDYEEKNKLLAGSICMNLGIIGNLNDISIPTHLPARFEIMARNPLIVIDGAHNPSKIKTTIHNLKELAYQKLSIIIAISADKDWKTMLKLLLPITDTLYITRFNIAGRQCVNPKELMRFAKKRMSSSNKIYFCSDPIQAFDKAEKNISKNDALLVTGSFYLAGEIRALYCPEEKILKQRNSVV